MKMMAGAGVSVGGGAGMLRTRRRDCSVKPNRKLDRKSSRGMIYENEELRLRTIHINAEVEQGKGVHDIIGLLFRRKSGLLSDCSRFCRVEISEEFARGERRVSSFRVILAHHF